MVSHSVGGPLALQTFAPQLTESAEETVRFQQEAWKRKSLHSLQITQWIRFGTPVGDLNGSMATTFRVQLLR